MTLETYQCPNGCRAGAHPNEGYCPSCGEEVRVYQTQYTTEQLLVAHRMGDCLTYPSIGALAADLRNHLVETLTQADAQLAALTAALQALADDYEAICGDGMTDETQPAVLRNARVALTAQGAANE